MTPTPRAECPLHEAGGHCPLYAAVERHTELLDGTNGDPGMRIRLDRVERIATALVWVVSSFSAAVIVATVGLVFSVIAHR